MAPAALFPRLVAAVSAVAGLVSIQPGFSDETIDLVRWNLNKVANASWERGTQAEALTELSWPSLSVFNSSAFPPRLNGSHAMAADVLDIANKTVSAKDPNTLALMEDGATGDPASLGTAVLLANWTHTDRSNKAYATAAGEQLDYLLNVAPKTEKGAISHREEQVQLWADFVYMAPPFIAYFGALQGGTTELALGQIAYQQCLLYRETLRDDNGLWRHIALGSWEDKTHWATGNAWAAAGMLRVHQALAHGSQAKTFAPLRSNLTQWIQEIIATSWEFQTPEGGLRNVIDDPNSFVDTAATSMMGAVTYRMAVVTNDTSLIPKANKALKFIRESVNKDGWLQDTVDPYTFHSPSAPGVPSPEGQAFVLLLHAAWRDFVRSIKPQNIAWIVHSSV